MHISDITPGADVDICFGGRIAVTAVRLLYIEFDIAVAASAPVILLFKPPPLPIQPV